MKLPSTALKLEAESPERAELRRDVRKGLRAAHKRIPSKYFYDARGSALFERICTLPEYYLTRVELGILRRQLGDIADAVGPGALVVEFGSGSGIKTQMLLQALHDPVAYAPVEISRSALDASLRKLRQAFPALELLPVGGDFNAVQRLPRPRRAPRSVLIYFPGSTIGNLETTEAVRLLGVMRTEMGRDGAALIGYDLKKDPALIEAAYNDREGVTAAFTLNLLRRLNRELDMDFDLSGFRHEARYDARAGRIETHLLSLRAQQVHLDGEPVRFAAGERVLVEYSCKYAAEDMDRMAAAAGLRVARSWTDADKMFAVSLLRRAAAD